MNENQELFNKIAKEISNKRKILPSLKEKLDKSSERYNKLFEEITTMHEAIEEKKEELEELIHKNDNKIFYKLVIIVAVLTALTGLLLTLLSINFIAYLQIPKIYLNIITGICAGITIIILPTFIGANIVKKIFKKLTKKSQNEIISSIEYQNLVKEIEKLETNLSIKKNLQRIEEKNLDKIKTEYNVTTTEINMKETLSEHLINNKKASPNNMDNQTDYKEPEEIAILKRTRKKIK